MVNRRAELNAKNKGDLQQNAIKTKGFFQMQFYLWQPMQQTVENEHAGQDTSCAP
jgi:hypothetical protein